MDVNINLLPQFSFNCEVEKPKDWYLQLYHEKFHLIILVNDSVGLVCFNEFFILKKQLPHYFKMK
jgi:hypothetical protein